MPDKEECGPAERDGYSGTAGPKAQPQDEWTLLIGQTIEVLEHGRIIDTGRVEEVTSDGLILWLEMYGAKCRRLIEKGPVREVKVV